MGKVGFEPTRASTRSLLRRLRLPFRHFPMATRSSLCCAGLDVVGMVYIRRDFHETFVRDALLSGDVNIERLRADPARGARASARVCGRAFLVPSSFGRRDRRHERGLHASLARARHDVRQCGDYREVAACISTKQSAVRGGRLGREHHLRRAHYHVNGRSLDRFYRSR